MCNVELDVVRIKFAPEEVPALVKRIAELEAQQAVLVEALGKTASHIEAMMAHIEHKPQRFKEHCWSQAVAARAALAAVKHVGQKESE